MTTAARIVLGDCEEALQELIVCDSDEAFSTSPDLEKPKLRNFSANIGSIRRRRWMTVVSLLRAVGHVLKNVDGKSSPMLGEIIETEWDALIKTKPEPLILWGFIENERNTVLKEYRFRSQGVAWGVCVTSLTVPTTSGPVTLKANKGASNMEFRLLADGPFAGRNDVDVVTEAIQWWKIYLDKIDALEGERGTS